VLRIATLSMCAMLCAAALGAGLLIARETMVTAATPDRGMVATAKPTSPAPQAGSVRNAAMPLATARPTDVPPTLAPVKPPATTAPIISTPAPEPVESTPTPAYDAYVVRQGDILRVIAAQHSAAISDILAVNAIENPDSVRVGQVLRIPRR
jgi:LysM repeat protein